MLQILSCRYSDISLAAFLLTEFRTFRYNSEWFVIVLATACQEFWSRYLPYQTASCFRGHFQGLYFKQLWLVKIIVISLLICLEASLARILKFSEKTFRCLFLSKTITFEPIWASLLESPFYILPCIDSWTNEYNEWSKISNWGQKLHLNSPHIETYFNKLQFFLGSKFTSPAEGGGFYWLICDSRWQNEIIVRVGGFQNPGVCLQAFPSSSPSPFFYSLHFLAAILCSRTPQKCLLCRLASERDSRRSSRPKL